MAQKFKVRRLKTKKDFERLRRELEKRVAKVLEADAKEAGGCPSCTPVERSRCCNAPITWSDGGLKMRICSKCRKDAPEDLYGPVLVIG